MELGTVASLAHIEGLTDSTTRVLTIYAGNNHRPALKRYNVQGSWPALVTPFDDSGEVNFEALRRLIDFHAEYGSNGVLLLGSTGEPILLNREERRSIVEAAVDHSNGRIPIMCGVSAPSTAETIEYAKHAKDAGVDCGLMVQPPYVKPTQAAIYNYFKDVADAVDLPIVILQQPRPMRRKRRAGDSGEARPAHQHRRHQGSRS